ncbi:hypothetical protein HMPREF9062_1702 [Actinomyces sp. oral taxon 448 str. F0400]|nr:hypothetical protein HMPREF9062_1702 [Actinomyces sp. oral taxon 448 str. F0400]
MKLVDGLEGLKDHVASAQGPLRRLGTSVPAGTEIVASRSSDAADGISAGDAVKPSTSRCGAPGRRSPRRMGPPARRRRTPHARHFNDSSYSF